MSLSTHEYRRRMRMFDMMGGVALTVAAVGLLTFGFVGRAGFDFGYVAEKLPNFLRATQLTLYITTISYVLGMGIGFLIGWARTSRGPGLKKVLRDRSKALDSRTPEWNASLEGLGIVLWMGLRYVVRRIADGYVELIRGTPLFVQIVFIWSVLLVNYPRMSQMEVIAGLIALTLNTGAYQGEIFRAGLQTVHTGQVEAGRAIGLSRGGTMRHVVLPQALRLIIPPLTNEYIGLLKASSLLVVIGVVELTSTARGLAFTDFKVFEMFALVSAFYLMITVPLSKAVETIERKFRIPGLGSQSGSTFRL